MLFHIILRQVRIPVKIQIKSKFIAKIYEGQKLIDEYIPHSTWKRKRSPIGRNKVRSLRITNVNIEREMPVIIIKTPPFVEGLSCER